MPAPLDPYRDLTAKIDAFFARVAARHGDDLQCAAGCSACCRQRLTITAVEAAAIEAWAATRAAAERAEVAAAAAAAAPDACTALAADGRCRIYDARPLVCRSHGVPVRMRSARGLPVVESCDLNFRARGPAAADPDCVLDQELVSTMLGLVDRRFAAADASGAPPARVDLADVLTGLAGR